MAELHGEVWEGRREDDELENRANAFIKGVRNNDAD